MRLELRFGVEKLKHEFHKTHTVIRRGGFFKLNIAEMSGSYIVILFF